jgi:hypothetical protein
MLDVVDLGKNNIGAISCGSCHVVVRVALTNRCWEVKGEVFDDGVPEPDVYLGLFRGLKRLDVQLFVLLVQRES